ncbi:MAG: type ISP restriction/modification enzyme [Candidatus Cloacimonas sp.]|nr:type ISP restriction/modification enzyme [Candidatus Cloacimonas sp.]
MIQKILTDYLHNLQTTLNRTDAREESFYEALANLLRAYSAWQKIGKFDITTLPKATEAGNPDFRVWDGKNHITGYIEAKAPHVYQLDAVSVSEQLKRYLATFPNVILTNFYEFRLYQHGIFVCSVTIGSAANAINLGKTPPLEKAKEMEDLLIRYFAFSLPAITDPKTLAQALAKRTRFLRDEILKYELIEEEKQGKKVLLNFYDSFKKLLINNLSLEQFADLYAQTLTYGIFAARTRSEGEFNRELIHKYIPKTLGVLKSIFKFISYEEPPKALEVLIDDIADILYVTDIQQILHKFYVEGKGSDPIVHFYETFLGEYDPSLRKSRGVYYTPEPVVRYIVRSINSLLKSHFGLGEGLADKSVTVLDPAAGTLTFPAEAIKTALQEYTSKYGTGGTHGFIKEHILPHFYAIELMMAPYTVGHLKIGYLMAELGYEMSDDERFKLYLSNTLEPDVPAQLDTIFTHEITEECEHANVIKKQEPVLVIMGNPPYSGASENTNEWTEKLMKTALDGAQDYYTVDGKPLGERNSKGIQDDYVKFLRFAQWKIHKAGKGIVGMITNHGYLDNPTFRGLRQSLMHTFDEIYVLDLHGNSKKKEKCEDGSKDENVFDIQQGTAIVLMIKVGSLAEATTHVGSASDTTLTSQLHHTELFGLRKDKYTWLEQTDFDADNYHAVNPTSPFYLFHPEATGNEHYLAWLGLPDIFPVNSVGIVTARDSLTIQDTKQRVKTTINHFAALEVETARIAYNLGKDSSDWKVDLAQKDLKDSGLSDDKIVSIMYRPFDTRYTYFTGKSSGFHCRTRNEVMRHMLQENLAIVGSKRVEGNHDWNHTFVTNYISTNHSVSIKEANYLTPLYLYPDEHKDDIFANDERKYNINPKLLDGFTKLWGDKFSPEQLFYYIYAIMYSNSYRSRYAQYLRMDFPRIPFTQDYALFAALAGLGEKLAKLHLLDSPLLDPPLCKYQGKGANDMVEAVSYKAADRTVRINSDKYFDNISAELWNYHIGGYQVLHKYLKDRKGKTLDDPIHYCRIVTAISKTIELQREIDGVYEKVDAKKGGLG